MSDILLSFEVMDFEGIDLVRRIDPYAVYPVEQDHPFYVLIETCSIKSESELESGTANQDNERLYKVLEECDSIIKDGVFS